MKKLSLKECKKRCAELWNWLADNPTSRKIAWPRWGYNCGKYPYVLNNCFACEFSRSRNTEDVNCSKCFLLGLWFNDKIPKSIRKMIEEGYTPCEDAQHSAFKLWTRYNAHKDKKASFYAKKIANYCKKH